MLLQRKGAVVKNWGLYSLATLAACFVLPAVGNAKAPTTDVLKIDVTASIANRCGIQASGPRTNNTGRIDTATTINFNFRLDCNTAFRIGVAAQNGALQLVSDAHAARDAAGFATAKKYKVGLSFSTDQDGVVDVGNCDSGKLNAADPTCAFYGARPGAGFSPGRNTTAIGRDGALTVSWEGEDSEPVRHAAGAYREVLTVVVAPRT